jgi:hypothetical protein
MAAGPTITSGQTGMFFAAWMGSDILEELRAYDVSKPLLKYEGRKPSKVFSFPRQVKPIAAVSNQAEGTAFIHEALTTDKADATGRLNGQVATVNDVLDAVSIVDAVAHFSGVLGRSLAEEIETTICSAIHNGFTTAITASTVLLLSDVASAIGGLEAQDIMGDLKAVIHPTQTMELSKDLTGTAAAAFFGSERGAAAADGGLSAPRNGGDVGRVLGVDFKQTSAVVLSTTYRGAVFTKEAAGLYEIWDVKSESHRDAFQPGTQLAATSDYGVAIIRDAWGKGLRST